MAKVNSSITLDKKISTKGKEQAKKEHHSFSSFIEKLIADYLLVLKGGKNGK